MYVDICIKPTMSDSCALRKESKEEYGLKLVDIENRHDVDCVIIAVSHTKFKNMSMEEYNKLD